MNGYSTGQQIADDDCENWHHTPKTPWCQGCGYTIDRDTLANTIEAAIATAVRAERERCAKVAREFLWKPPRELEDMLDELMHDVAREVGGQIAAAIEGGDDAGTS